MRKLVLAVACLLLTWYGMYATMYTPAPKAATRPVTLTATITRRSLETTNIFQVVRAAPVVVEIVKPQTLADLVYPKIQRRLPYRDREILLRVAQEEGLDPEQTNFLLTVRIIENGRPGLELGVGDGIPGHPARRFAGNHDKSLRLQGQWVAGAIKKRYRSIYDLYTFASHHCPLNTADWYRNATHYMGGMS